MEKTIKVCQGHQDRQTPLMFTMAFPGAEYWCPWCGYIAGMLGAGESVEETEQLTKLAEADAEYARPYIRAIAMRSADQVKHNGEWIKPRELPDEVKAANAKIIADWRYRSKPKLSRPAKPLRLERLVRAHVPKEIEE